MTYKFAAYSKDQKKLIYPENLDFQLDIHSRTLWEDFVDESDVEIFPFIGLQDKNERDIYADCSIVKFKLMKELDKVVELVGVFTFNEEDLSYEIDIIGDKEYVCLNYVGNGIFYDFEIVGTVQENPELMKVYKRD